MNVLRVAEYKGKVRFCAHLCQSESYFEMQKIDNQLNSYANMTLYQNNRFICLFILRATPDKTDFPELEKSIS